MNLDTNAYHIGRNLNCRDVIEERDCLSDEHGFSIELNNIFLDDIHLKWGAYQSPTSKHYSVCPSNDSIVAHFCLAGSCITQEQECLNMRRGECVLFKESATEYLYEMGTDNNRGEFFEVSLTPELYTNLFAGENYLLDQVLAKKDSKLFGNIWSNPLIKPLINEMFQNRTCYSGRLKKLYLESKVIELLLLQTQHMQTKQSSKALSLSSTDVEALYFVRELLNKHLEETTSIAELALEAGINQTKLKQGFKELFGNTVFGYLTDQRMMVAKNLLLENNLPVNEIANIVGYKHPQHFTVAFKKVMGYLPSELRS